MKTQSFSKLCIITFGILLLFPINQSFSETGNIVVDDFNVNYEIDGGTVLSVFLDPTFVELIVMFGSTNDGILEITIPRLLLDAKFDNSDDIFFILVDGFETDFAELEPNSNSRTLVIPFFAGDEILEIIGTTALEDFGIISNIEIPNWVKNNAGWWADGQIEDSDFVSGIQFLITEGIMSIPETQSGQGTSQEIPGWIKNNAGWWADGQIEDSDFVSGIQYLVTNGIMKI